MELDRNCKITAQIFYLSSPIVEQISILISMIKNIQRAKDDGKREKTALPPFFPSHRLPRAFFLSPQSPWHQETSAQERVSV